MKYKNVSETSNFAVSSYYIKGGQTTIYMDRIESDIGYLGQWAVQAVRTSLPTSTVKFRLNYILTPNGWKNLAVQPDIFKDSFNLGSLINAEKLMYKYSIFSDDNIILL